MIFLKIIIENGVCIVNGIVSEFNVYKPLISIEFPKLTFTEGSNTRPVECIMYITEFQ